MSQRPGRGRRVGHGRNGSLGTTKTRTRNPTRTSCACGPVPLPLLLLSLKFRHWVGVTVGSEAPGWKGCASRSSGKRCDRWRRGLYRTSKGNVSGYKEGSLLGQDSRTRLRAQGWGVRAGVEPVPLVVLILVRPLPNDSWMVRRAGAKIGVLIECGLRSNRGEISTPLSSLKRLLCVDHSSL